MVNEAYKTLSQPLARALYLLDLHGHALDSETVEGGGEGGGGDLLSDIFMLNFEVGESEDIDELAEILRNVNEDIATYLQVADDAFTEGDYVRAKQTVVRLKYYYNIKDTIDEKIFNLSLGRR